MHRKVSSEEKRRVKIDLCDIRVSQICLSVRLSVCESATFGGFLSCVLAIADTLFLLICVPDTGELPASFHHFGGEHHPFFVTRTIPRTLILFVIRADLSKNTTTLFRPCRRCPPPFVAATGRQPATRHSTPSSLSSSPSSSSSSSSS